MKDPLQEVLQEKDPYEILGVSEIATKEEINKAFTNCVASRRNVKDVTWARNVLINPTERIFYDLFRYNEIFLDHLRPRLSISNSLLTERKRFAETWSNIQKRMFPHFPSTHSLALLWYWWTLYREEELWFSINHIPFNKKEVSPFSASSNKPFCFKKNNQALAEVKNIDELAWAIDKLRKENQDCVIHHLKEGHIQEWLAKVLGEDELAVILLKIYDPDKAYNKITEYILKKLWKKTIANWVFLINSEEFWSTWIKQKSSIYTIGSNNIEKVQQKLHDHLINKFHNYWERYHNKGDSDSAKRYREYEDLFLMEKGVAQLMVQEDIKILKKEKYFVVSCGSIMLEELEILKPVKTQIEEAIKENPHKKSLKELFDLISPYGWLINLFKNRRFDEVIQAIEELPKQEKNKKDILSILAKAYLEKGKQYFSSKNYKEAFDCWRKALKTGEEILQEIKEAIVSNCKSEVVLLQKSDPDTAIEILKEGINLTEDKELKLLLGELYNRKGVELVNRALEGIGGGGITSKIINQIKEGISYLEEAVKLGYREAAENLKRTKEILGEVYNRKGVELVNKAQKEVIELIERKIAPKTEILEQIENQIKEGISYLEEAVKLGYREAAENLKRTKEILILIESIKQHGLPPPSPPPSPRNKIKAFVVVLIIFGILLLCSLKPELFFLIFFLSFLFGG